MLCCTSFGCGTLLKVGDKNCHRYYKVKIVKVNETDQTLKIHYVGFSDRYDEVLPISSSRIEAWGGDGRLGASVAAEVYCFASGNLDADGNQQQRKNSQLSLTDLEAFLDKSALRVSNIAQNIDLEDNISVAQKCDMTGCSVGASGGGEGVVAVSDEVQVQDKKDKKFYNCKVPAVKEDNEKFTLKVERLVMMSGCNWIASVW